MAELMDLVLIAGIGGGGLAYVTNFKGFKDWVNAQLKFGSIGGCVGHCTTGYHLDASSCTCVPDGCTKTCQTGQHVSSTCTCVPDTITGGTGTWFKANGPSKAMPRARCSDTNCGQGSGGNSGGNRWENDFPGAMKLGYEVVIYFSIPAGKMCSGGHIGLKHGGPNHKSCSSNEKIPCGSCSSSCSGSGCCCWWDSGFHNDQVPYLEIERPHACNIKTKTFPKINTRLDSGKPIGVRWHISKEGSGIRLIMWIDTAGVTGGNKWTLIYNVLDTGQIMPTSYINKITSSQNVEIRISDVKCSDIKILQAPVSRLIVAGSGYTHVLPTGYVSRFTDLVTPMLAD